MDKVNLADIDESTHWTVTMAETATGQDKATVNKAVLEAKLEPVASVVTGKRGRPPKLYSRTELQQAVDSLLVREQAAAAAAAQTDKESAGVQAA